MVVELFIKNSCIINTKQQNSMKKISSLSIVLLLVSSIFIGCTSGGKSNEPVFDVTVAKKEIEEANRNFMELVAKGDSVGLANSYTVDAKFMSAGAPAVKGRANIQHAMSEIVKSGITKVDLRMKEVFGIADLIAEEGELTLYVKDEVVAEEKYIVLWKKEDGKWKLFRDIFNSNLAVPTLK